MFGSTGTLLLTGGNAFSAANTAAFENSSTGSRSAYVLGGDSKIVKGNQTAAAHQHSGSRMLPLLAAGAYTATRAAVGGLVPRGACECPLRRRVR